jgi:hypothetical protein
MATFSKFDIFTTNLAEKIHHLGTDTLNIYLTNTQPLVTNTIKANIAEIATGNGYTGPIDTQNTGAGSAGTYTVTGTKIVITATGAIGPFRFVVLYNDTPGAPVDPLIGWWDYGSSITLQNGETFTIKFNNGDPTGTILTLA